MKRIILILLVVGFFGFAYADDFVLTTPEPETAPMFAKIAFDRVIAKLNAQQQAASLTQAQEQAVVQAKRDAGFVQGGASSVAPTSNSEVKITSVADAWAAAKQQMSI